jgi:hypothetical protein
MNFVDCQHTLPNTLYGRGLPQGCEVRKFENPKQRAAAYHFAKGMGVKEVAQACEVTPQCVTQWLKNPWFQERVTELLHAAGFNEVEALLKGEGINSYLTLVELRDDPQTPKHVRSDIAKDILNRVLGKPVQRVETDATVRSGDPVEEVRRLEEENALLASRLKDRSPVPTS